MSKEIDQDVKLLKEDIKSERQYLGPYPLSTEDLIKWNRIYKCNLDIAKSINKKINTYNLIVPLIDKQKFHLDFDKICDEILQNGAHSVEKKIVQEHYVQKDTISHDEDLFSVFFKAVSELLNFSKKKIDNTKQ